MKKKITYVTNNKNIVPNYITGIQNYEIIIYELRGDSVNEIIENLLADVTNNTDYIATQ